MKFIFATDQKIDLAQDVRLRAGGGGGGCQCLLLRLFNYLMATCLIRLNLFTSDNRLRHATMIAAPKPAVDQLNANITWHVLITSSPVYNACSGRGSILH